MNKKIFLIGLLVALFFAVADSWAAITDFDKRERARSPVAIEVVSVTIDWDVDSTVGTATITTNGRVEQIVITTPDLQDDTTTLSFRIKDENGVILEQTPDAGGVSRFAPYSRIVYRPNKTVLIAGTTTVEITATAEQTIDADVTVELYLR